MYTKAAFSLYRVFVSIATNGTISNLPFKPCIENDFFFTFFWGGGVIKNKHAHAHTDRKTQTLLGVPVCSNMYNQHPTVAKVNNSTSF